MEASIELLQHTIQEVLHEVRELRAAVDRLSLERSPTRESPSVSVEMISRPTEPTETQPVVRKPLQVGKSDLESYLFEENKWLPIKLYGKIERKSGYYVYTFSKNSQRVPFTDEASEKEALQVVRQYQIDESLRNPRNNRYRIVNGVVNLELADGTPVLVDASDLPIIFDHVFYSHRGHVILRIGDKRVRLSELLTSTKDVLYRNGNTNDNRRSNLIVSDGPAVPGESNELFPEITPDSWANLKDQARSNDMQMDIVTNYLDNMFQRYPSFPLVQYTEKDLFADYQRVVTSPNSNISNLNYGAKVTAHFMQATILLARKPGYPTVEEVWRDKDKRLKLWQAMIRLDLGKLTRNSLYKAYGLKYYRCSNFPPLAARNLYDYVFLPEVKNKRVLDFCSGYGGRFMGFWASTTCTEYVGIDPNPHLVKPYQELSNWIVTHFSSANIKKKFQFLQACAEEVDTSTLGQFDIIFTSPPYFNLEVYTDDPHQSCHRYPQLEMWRDYFLFRAIDRLLPTLKPRGVFAINIKNSNKWKIDLCQQMVDFIVSKGLRQKETITLPVAKRPGMGVEKDSSEPIYVFVKP